MLAFQIAAIITCTSHIVAGTDGVIPSSGATTNWVTVWVCQADIPSASLQYDLNSAAGTAIAA